MTKAHRDLAAPELWIRSLERSRRRRELLPKARRENNRRKHLSAALATAVVAGPSVPVAAAQASGDVSAAIAAESPANRAIEIREGGLPLQVGSQGELVAHVQRALQISADGVFGVQTDAAVRSYQRSAGLEVDGIVGLATWGALFESRTASGADVGGSNVPAAVKEHVEQRLEQAGRELAAQGQVQAGAEGAAPEAGTPAPGAPQSLTTTPAPAPTGQACGSATISSPVHGTVTSSFGPRWGRNHDGVDIAAPSGTPVRAAACGTVSLAGQQSGYGNIVCITHTSQFSTCYAHLSRFGVSSGARVQQGQVIGYVGCTGSCTGPHLHFETRVGGEPRNPQAYLAGASIPGRSAASASQDASAAGTSPGGTATTSTGSQATVAQDGTSPAAGADSLEQSTTPTGTTATGTTATGTTTATTTTATTTTTTTAPAETSALPAETAPVPAETASVPAEIAPATDATVTDTTATATEGDGTVTATAPTAPAADAEVEASVAAAAG